MGEFKSQRVFNEEPASKRPVQTMEHVRGTATCGSQEHDVR